MHDVVGTHTKPCTVTNVKINVHTEKKDPENMYMYTLEKFPP